MHVVIAQLSSAPGNAHYSNEDEVFQYNSRYFPDGVEEHHDEQRDDDIKSILDWFGEAARHGTEKVGDKTVTWFEVSKTKALALFDEYWKEFHKLSEKISLIGQDDFCKAPSNTEHMLEQMNNLFHFDWCYFLDDYGVASPISDWVRCIRNDNEKDYQRFYIHATYDGDQ